MVLKEYNYAFIDGQNLNLNIRLQGWFLDFTKFRIYLKEKYGVQKAYLFIGYIEENKDLYYSLKRSGYICVFKPVLEYKNNGDFQCLIKYLLFEQKLKTVLIPNSKKYSSLLKTKEIRPYLQFMDGLDRKLKYIKEKPL